MTDGMTIPVGLETAATNGDGVTLDDEDMLGSEVLQTEDPEATEEQSANEPVQEVTAEQEDLSGPATEPGEDVSEQEELAGTTDDRIDAASPEEDSRYRDLEAKHELTQARYDALVSQFRLLEAKLSGQEDTGSEQKQEEEKGPPRPEDYSLKESDPEYFDDLLHYRLDKHRQALEADFSDRLSAMQQKGMQEQAALSMVQRGISEIDGFKERVEGPLSEGTLSFPAPIGQLIMESTGGHVLANALAENRRVLESIAKLPPEHQVTALMGAVLSKDLSFGESEQPQTRTRVGPKGVSGRASTGVQPLTGLTKGSALKGDDKRLPVDDITGGTVAPEDVFVGDSFEGLPSSLWHTTARDISRG